MEVKSFVKAFVAGIVGIVVAVTIFGETQKTLTPNSALA